MRLKLTLRFPTVSLRIQINLTNVENLIFELKLMNYTKFSLKISHRNKKILTYIYKDNNVGWVMRGWFASPP